MSGCAVAEYGISIDDLSVGVDHVEVVGSHVENGVEDDSLRGVGVTEVSDYFGECAAKDVDRVGDHHGVLSCPEVHSSVVWGVGRVGSAFVLRHGSCSDWEEVGMSELGVRQVVFIHLFVQPRRSLYNIL